MKSRWGKGGAKVQSYVGEVIKILKLRVVRLAGRRCALSSLSLASLLYALTVQQTSQVSRPLLRRPQWAHCHS